jgi:hypothetical protein
MPTVMGHRFAAQRLARRDGSLSDPPPVVNQIQIDPNLPKHLELGVSRLDL